MWRQSEVKLQGSVRPLQYLSFTRSRLTVQVITLSTTQRKIINLSTSHGKFLREPRQEKHTDLDHVLVDAQTISFHHPHPNNVFLTLLASDHSSDGLHHLTALMACGIVAGNRFNGYFSTLNGQAIEDSPDSVLQGQDYCFYVLQSE